MGILNRVLWILKAFLNCIVWNQQYFEKFEEEKKIGGGGGGGYENYTIGLGT